MKLYMIRHALSTSNGLCRWTGQQDADLSEKGIREQTEIMSRYEYPAGDLYVSSPLLRCTRSMSLIYGRGADILMPELAECALGLLEGEPYTNLNNDPNYLSWLNEPEMAFPGGESFNSFAERSRRGFLKILTAAEDRDACTVIAMMHGNVMRAILHSFADSRIPHSLWQIPNGGVYALELDPAAKKITEWRHEPDFLFQPYPLPDKGS